VAWLLCDGTVLASLEVAGTRAARRKGLLGLTEFDGALLLPGIRAVHTLGMRFSIDVAYLDGDDVVLHTATMRPNRVGLPVRRSRKVIETEAGALARWGVATGTKLEIRE